MIGFIIWAVKNTGVVYSSVQGGEVLFIEVLLRILIFFAIFGFISVFFDIFTVREIVNFFSKRFKKDTIAISVGSGKIIDINRKGKKITYVVKYFMGFLEIVCSFFVFSLTYVLFADLIVVEKLNLGTYQLDALATKYVLITFLIIFATAFLLRGLSRIY
jgi:hypothetical protein